MATMRAARFDRQTSTLSVADVPIPEPGPVEVLVRVEACGICLSDVHLVDGTLPAPLPQVTPGHEAAGVVERLGAMVPPAWHPGERVTMAGGRPDMTCPNCVRGRTDECLHTQIMGFDYDGAWAEYVTVPYGALSAIPADLPFEQAAILADAVATPYAGLVERAGLRAGETVGLWGVGGLGVHAVQVARLVGASLVVAVDPSPAARRRATERGADITLDPNTDDVPYEVRRHTGGRGLDLAVDLVGANAVLAQADSCLGRFGRLLMIGLSSEPVQLGPSVMFGTASHTLLGHLGYHKRHLDQLVDLVRLGRLDVSGSVSDVLPLADVARGVERLASKEDDPIRLVVRPHG